MNGKVHVMDHPLVAHKLTILRDKNTSVKDFRELVSEIGMLITYEATRDLALTTCEVETPICKTTAPMLKGKKFAVVPILRAGLGLVDGVLRMVPSARVGHIGLYRDEETLEPVKYFCKMPKDVAERDVLIVDPMLATGGSAEAAIGFMKEYRHQADGPPGRAGGHRPHPEESSGRGHLLRRRGRTAQREWLHCPRAGRRGRPDFRNEVNSRPSGRLPEGLVLFRAPC